MMEYAKENANECKQEPIDEIIDECICTSPLKKDMEVDVSDLDQNEQCPHHNNDRKFSNISNNLTSARKSHYSKRNESLTYNHRRQSAADGCFSAHYTFKPLNFANVEGAGVRKASMMFQRTPR